jgi:NAD(P)-dependent dehydrogenase (short-subunit alcohol dehydrogenase family)
VGGVAAEASCDIREADQVAAAFDAIESALGPVSLLINNAAANFPVLASATSANAWRAVNRIVVDGTFFCSQELHRRSVANGLDGSIVNIVATQAFTGGPGMAHASAAKAAVVNMTKSLAVEWAPDGVRVNAIAPGLFPHEEMRDDLKALRTSGADVDATRAPAMRLGERREIGWAATWLCSPFASFITGHTLVVDGANWLRRDFVMPPFTPIESQLKNVLRPKD